MSINKGKPTAVPAPMARGVDAAFPVRATGPFEARGTGAASDSSRWTLLKRDKWKVIAADEHERENHAGSAASATRPHTDRNTQQREDQAGCRERQPALQFDAGI